MAELQGFLPSSRIPVIPAYIVFGDPVTDPASALGQVTFDVIKTEEHVRGAVVTDHPVEQGVNIVDHVRPLPDRLTLEAFVSNSPINSLDAQRIGLTLDLTAPGQDSFLAGGTSALLAQGLQAIGLVKGFPSQITANVDQFVGETDYVRFTYDTLTSLRDNATLLQIITPRQTYTDMILEDVKLHRDQSTGTSGEFTLDFRQIRIITSSVTDAPQPSILRNEDNVSQGKKDATPADGPKKSGFAHIEDIMTGKEKLPF